jgi:mannosyltransferase
LTANYTRSVSRLTVSLAVLLAADILRLWLMPLPSSFWTDETNSVFLVRYGASHPSLAASPQLADSIYNALPSALDALGGHSEAAYRLPSTLAMGLALCLIGCLAARLIRPEAAWVAVFACLAMHGFTFQAADARPYALGTAILAAGLWFEVLWFDRARWREAALFLVFAALLWRVHPLYWPMYLVFAGYAIARLALRDTPVTWLRAGAVFALVAVALLPVLTRTLALAASAQTHVIWDVPGPRALVLSLQPVLLGGCFAGAWLLSRLCRWHADSPPLTRSSLALIALWWACDPVSLFSFARLTGISVFVPRYYSLALPGAALAAVALAAPHIPSRFWKPLGVALGLVVLLRFGDWRDKWPPHGNADWRAAASTVDRLAPSPDTPIVCPSPFVEALPPVWHSGYPLPSILYAPLVAYPLRGRVIPFPFRPCLSAIRLADSLSHSKLQSRFFVYGRRDNTLFWENWFARRPALAGWTHRRLGPFGELEVIEFDPPGSI